ncbi:hypothetical protein EVJ58_g6906 [Rhodofomes roseus]|uniref:MYND-type domain-containing protein n=1 Tax=Rhodofomes roseus TaxID=34475 RepID=A0A4Y9Y9Y0_9APHY|nr:hypothetical protein EVJ58_g6906 [Rhodofomes roseus]
MDGHELNEPFAPDIHYRTPQTQSYLYIRMAHHGYLTACAKFVSLPRSEEEMRRLRTDVFTCECSLPENEDARRLVQRLHTFGTARAQFELDDLVHALVRHLAGILNHAVMSQSVGGMTAVGYITENHVKSVMVRPWPVDTITQVVPHGLRQSMEGYAASLSLSLRRRPHEALLLFSTLLAICGSPIILPVLTLHPDWTSRVVDIAESLIDERTAMVGKSVDAGTEESWKDTFMLLVECAGDFSDTRYLDEGELNLLARVETVADADEEPKESRSLLSVCDRLLRHLPCFLDGSNVFTQGDMASFTQVLTIHGAAFYAHRLPHECLAVCPQILDYYNQERNTASAADPSTLAFHSIDWASTMRCCSAPECHETFVTVGRRLARCAGCGLLRFCSRACQKKAWKHAKLPHKAVCKKLRVLLERMDFFEHAEDADCGLQSFVDACEEDEELGELALDCAGHMYDLMAEQHDIREAYMAEAYREMQKRSLSRGDS